MLLPGFIKWQGCRHLPAIRWYIEYVYVRVYVACSAKVTCPVAMLKRYMDMVVCQTPLEYCSVRWKKGVSNCVHLANCHTLVYESCCWTGWNVLGSLSQIFQP